MIYAETNRLILRSWSENDLVPFKAINSDCEVMKYLPSTLSDKETENLYNRITCEFREKGFGLYALEIKETGEFIGFTGLHEIGFKADFTPGVEIGWRLASKYHNHGLATEAAIKALELARSIGLRHIHAFTSILNTPSERVMVKIGMKRMGEFNHPSLDESSRLSRHVLYTISL